MAVVMVFFLFFGAMVVGQKIKSAGSSSKVGRQKITTEDHVIDVTEDDFKSYPVSQNQFYKTPPYSNTLRSVDSTIRSKGSVGSFNKLTLPKSRDRSLENITNYVPTQMFVTDTYDV